jgi:4-oxalmesaconate hydratase
MTDEYWYPLYEAMVELDVPAMVHVSASCNPNFHSLGAHYLNADTSVFMQLVSHDLFDRFPALTFVIPHGGGAVPYHWGRYRGLAARLGRPDPRELLRNVYFDTCVYHQPGIDLLHKVIPINNVLFASEMLGAVRGADPQTGIAWDDTLAYIDQLGLCEADRRAVVECNARRVYPRLDRRLAAGDR